MPLYQFGRVVLLCYCVVEHDLPLFDDTTSVLHPLCNIAFLHFFHILCLSLSLCVCVCLLQDLRLFAEEEEIRKQCRRDARKQLESKQGVVRCVMDAGSFGGSFKNVFGSGDSDDDDDDDADAKEEERRDGENSQRRSKDEASGNREAVLVESSQELQMSTTDFMAEV